MCRETNLFRMHYIRFAILDDMEKVPVERPFSATDATVYNFTSDWVPETVRRDMLHNVLRAVLAFLCSYFRIWYRVNIELLYRLACFTWRIDRYSSILVNGKVEPRRA